MLTEFVGLQLTREELQEIRQALLQRAMLQEEVNKEKGVSEHDEPHPLLERIEGLLGDSEEQMHALDHVIEDGLWEYAWFAYTDEWAWYRARQEVERRLAGKGEKLTDAELQKQVEADYRKHFESYVAEIGMIEESKPVRSITRTQKSR